MKIGQKLVLDSMWSVTGESCVVTIIKMDLVEMTALIQYSDGYTEWLPISSLPIG